MERNLRVIPVYYTLAHTLVWLPIFVLFTRREHGLDGALTIAAAYYLAAVILEVPSGWLSDRVGRVFTLRLAAGAWIAAHTVFLIGGANFTAVIIGQVLMAVGFSSMSGTDVALHYDTLEALDRADEYESRQGRLASRAYLGATVGALAGGLLGLADLRLAFAISLAVAVAQLGSAWQLHEPPIHQQAEPLVRQLLHCGTLLRTRLLGWIFIYWVAMVVLEHVAATLSQPYLTEALDQTADDLGSTPLVVALQFATASAIGAGAAAMAPRVRARLGLPLTLFLLAGLSATIVTVMASIVHAAVIAVLVFRSVHGAAAPVLMTAAAAPLVEPRRRATYFSIHSLAGRLTYSSVLFVVAGAVGDELLPSLRALAAVAWVAVAVVLLTYLFMGRPRPLPASPSHPAPPLADPHPQGETAS